MQYSVRQQTAFLKSIGLTNMTRRKATLIFQRAYNLGTALKQDGDFGQATGAAANKVTRAGGKLSPNFHWKEIRCAHCGKWEYDYRAFRGLEDVRKRHYPNGLTLVSGYRCAVQNKRVGGVPGSLHTQGLAADIPRRVKPKDWLDNGSIRYFNEMGYKEHGLITHAAYNPNRTRKIYFKE